uniref:Multiple epidermal growth factor-like domains protein 10 isoform X2 n=1 Tax=Crassostrea virginica TaxID=6565 RepID=A0A8B8BWR0_CRAVI|nr:multiple epidermal growth factor-like domains protein 10 isoform X2 [Crassostrea virginica]XP_022307317.1 multiple epidermal growth factor-like domains protein 10 isoform X2 [Crassostrea virginica]
MWIFSLIIGVAYTFNIFSFAFGVVFNLNDFLSALDNMALHRPTYQQNQYKEISDHLTRASNGVDGLKSNLEFSGGQCVISADKQQTATWWVNLTSILSIHHVTVFFRTENIAWGPSNGHVSRALGFSLYVSNTTNKSEGHLCFKDTVYTLSTIPAVFNTSCPVHGQYVIYYNERLPGVSYPSSYSQYAFNDLCELEVYGCPRSGYYGNNCSVPCPDPQCNYCDLDTGTCRGGCNPGYKGHRCELECVDGLYGDGCRNTCGHCTDMTQCHHVTGTCLEGCIPGYMGNDCMQACSTGYYGENCSMSCGYCLKDETCHFVNGSCLSGCKIGYHPPFCAQECYNNTYGAGCTETCGQCRDSKPCHHINGSCVNGCMPGFKKTQCVEECDMGYYGIGCLQECSSFCKTSRDCHHVTGYCKDGCKSGWQGNDCLEVYKPIDSSNNQQSSFYSVLGLFCVSLLLNGVLIAYIIIQRKSRNKPAKEYQPESPAREMHIGQDGKSEFDSVNEGYQELGELGKSSTTYETLQ